MTTPSDREIREKFKVSGSVPVYRDLPLPAELARTRSFVVHTAELFGCPAWLWKSAGGALLGVILIAESVDSRIERLKPVIYTAYEYARPYLAALPHTGVRLTEDLIAFARTPGHGHRGGLVLAPFAANLDIARPPDERVTLWRVTRGQSARQAFESPLLVDTTWLRRGAWATYATESIVDAILQPNSPRDVLDRRSIIIRASIAAPSVRIADWIDVQREGGNPQVFAHHWLESGESALLNVPWKARREGRVILINLRHPDIARLEIDDGVPLNEIDPGLLGENRLF